MPLLDIRMSLFSLPLRNCMFGCCSHVIWCYLCAEQQRDISRSTSRSDQMRMHMHRKYTRPPLPLHLHKFLVLGTDLHEFGKAHLCSFPSFVSSFIVAKRHQTKWWKFPPFFTSPSSLVSLTYLGSPRCLCRRGWARAFCVALILPSNAVVMSRGRHTSLVRFGRAQFRRMPRSCRTEWDDDAWHVQLHLLLQLSIAPGQQLFYYGSRVWPDGVRKQMYDQFGGMPKDLLTAHDYDPKVCAILLSCMHNPCARVCGVSPAARARLRIPCQHWLVLRRCRGGIHPQWWRESDIWADMQTWGCRFLTTISRVSVCIYLLSQKFIHKSISIFEMQAHPKSMLTYVDVFSTVVYCLSPFLCSFFGVLWIRVCVWLCIFT